MRLFAIIREWFTDRGVVTHRHTCPCPDCGKPAELVSVIGAGNRYGHCYYETYVPPAKGQKACRMCGGVLVPQP